LSFSNELFIFSLKVYFKKLNLAHDRLVFLHLLGLFCLTIPYVAPVSYDKPPAVHDLVAENYAARGIARTCTAPPFHEDALCRHPFHKTMCREPLQMKSLLNQVIEDSSSDDEDNFLVPMWKSFVLIINLWIHLNMVAQSLGIDLFITKEKLVIEHYSKITSRMIQRAVSSF
jgi:hypothetical protein